MGSPALCARSMTALNSSELFSLTHTQACQDRWWPALLTSLVQVPSLEQPLRAAITSWPQALSPG